MRHCVSGIIIIKTNKGFHAYLCFIVGLHYSFTHRPPSSTSSVVCRLFWYLSGHDQKIVYAFSSVGAAEALSAFCSGSCIQNPGQWIVIAALNLGCPMA